MAKDYYIILGVGANATAEQIKSAYRREVKRCHPDRTGEGSEPFLDIQEAYDVLGDPGRRQAYDDELVREKRRARRAARTVRPEPLRPRRAPVEPLSPRETFGAPAFSSLFDELFRHPWGDLDTPVRPGTWRGAGEIHAQVTLSREQARYGGRIRIWVPVQVRCPACRGWGGDGFFGCLHCEGSGAVVDERPVDVEFPGGVADGVEGRLSLGPAVHLVLHFRVTGQV